MAEFRTPFFRSFLVNDLSLVKRVLSDDAIDFPKSDRVTRGLKPLLGRSVFVTNGAEWESQRRTIDPAFLGGQTKESFASMWDAAQVAVARMQPGDIDVESVASHATADVIFRTLFSIPIEDHVAQKTYSAFKAFQRAQPVATLSGLLPWFPVWHQKAARVAAADLRRLIAGLVAERGALISAGQAPEDLATKIMTTADPETRLRFSEENMTDQVAIFFLAGHETSAALLGWALWCLAAVPEWGDQVAEEAQAFVKAPDFSQLAKMPVTRNVLRETLRLYPPVPMFVRQAAKLTTFRNRKVRRGAQVVVSPWHLGRHETHWDNPDDFDPSRWENGNPAPREAWLPFSTGPRVCPGAGFAMAEAAILLASFMAEYRFHVRDTPVPVAHLTVRSRDGIRLMAEPR